MNEHQIEQIRTSDEDNILALAGVKWQETRNWVLVLISIPMFVVAMTFIMSFFGMFLTGFSKKPTTYFVVSVLSGYLVLYYGFQWAVRERSLTFHVDGRIKTPDGIPSNSAFREFPFDHERVTSIEKRFAGTNSAKQPQYFVDIKTREGESVTVGETLSDTGSHMLAVQLTKALNEVREAAAQPLDRFSVADALRHADETIQRARRHGKDEAEFVIN